MGNLDPGARARAVDVRLGDDGSEQVLTPDALASRENEAAPWRIVRPALAPGAVATRICAAAGRRWIATDRGLFAEEAEGAWVRLPPGAVFAAVTDVAGDASRVLAATQQGLLEGHVDATQRARAASLARSALALEFPGRREPAVQDIFAAALDHLSLRPEAMRSLRTGLSARGLFPKLELRVERGRARTTDVADDESFVSGDIRRLHDQNGRSVHDVTALGVPLSRVVVGGFSQGACLACEYVWQHPARYGGLVAFSGGLIGPPGTTWASTPAYALDGLPAFLGCSDVDNHVPKWRVEESAEALRGIGADVTLRLYPGIGHLVNDDEIAHARALLQRAMA